MTIFKVNVLLEVDEQFLLDILTTAAEGGIGYWALYDLDRDDDLNVTRIHTIQDAESEEDSFDKTYVDIWDIHTAIGKILSFEVDHLSARFVDRLAKAVAAGPDGVCDLDADDCDVIVQVAMFEEVVYG